ncbi:MAG: hypothetical protein ABI905_12480 [Betaproteobacteria bacterium]
MSTRRMIVFGLALVLAASPLVWFGADPSAGDKLLKWTSKSQSYPAQR